MSTIIVESYAVILGLNLGGKVHIVGKLTHANPLLNPPSGTIANSANLPNKIVSLYVKISLYILTLFKNLDSLLANFEGLICTKLILSLYKLTIC